jgi:type I restriction enzyme S subunit
VSKLCDILAKPLVGEWGNEDEVGNGIPVLRTTNFTNEGFIDYSNVATRTIDRKKVKDKLLTKGDIIIEKSGGGPSQPVGRVVFFDGEEYKYLFNNFTSVLRLKNQNMCFPKYVFYQLFNNHKKGATRKFQNKTTGILNLKLDRLIKETNVLIPHLDTQKQIAKTLDTASKLLAMRKQQLAELDVLIKSVFYDMFGDPVTNEKRWQRYPLSEILIRIDSGRSPVCLDKPANSGEWGVLKLSAITQCYFNPNENKALPENEKPNQENEIIIGDVLFSRKNTRDLVAACVYVWETNPRLLLSDLIFRFVPKDFNVINPIFLQELFSFPSKRKGVQELASGAAGSMPNISKAKLLNHLIEVPPIGLQNKFASIVTKIQEQKTLVQKSFYETQTLFDALMSQYFE